MYQKPAAPDAPELQGKVGRYELIAHIATGGMGEVFLARLPGEAGFERLLVVKMLLPELSRDPEFEAMFLHEARIAARLSHPNVCEVQELGRDGNRLFLVMPYLRGLPLGEAFAQGPETSPAHYRRVGSLMRQACAGLHHAHELVGADGESLGLVHRDVSPANLFVTTDGVVKVLDFGIAKARGTTIKTARDEIKGNYAYMSPEQIRAAELDRRSDVFALGAVMWQCLVGRPLFARSSDILTAKAIIEEAIPRADDVEAAVPQELAEVAARALERSPERRYSSARQLGDAIGNALDAIGGEIMPADLGAWLSSTHSAPIEAKDATYERATVLVRRPTPPAKSQLSPPAEKRPLLRALAAASVMLLGAIALYLLTDPDPAPKGHASSAPPPAVAKSASPSDASSATGSPLSNATPTATAPLATESKTLASSGANGNESANAKARQSHKIRPETSRSEPVPKVVETRPKSNPKTEQAKAEPGFISIDSTPYATIYVDNKRVGVTPIIRHRVPAGRRRIRAVLESGKSRTLSVTIPAGELAPPQLLNW